MKNLKEISLEMRKQDNRATQYPMFVVQDKIRKYHFSEFCNGEEKERRDGDSIDYDDICEGCTELSDKGEEMPLDCDLCEAEAFAYYIEEWEFDLKPGVFFTAKACDEHIRLNHYHYNKGARSYGIGSWRNEEMVAVQQSILKLTDNEIPSQYK